MLMLLAVQAAIALAAPTPPPTPPRNYQVPMIVAAAQVDRPTPMRLAEFDVVIRSPAGPLWAGRLRVGDRGGESSWSQTRNEPPSEPCPTQRYYGSGEREMLSVSLTMFGRDTADGLVVQARWARRGDAACDGLRTVEVRQMVQVAGPQPIVVNGDGGLRVELRRRG